MSQLIESDSSQLLKYNAGDIIFDYGDSADDIYIVVQGEIILSKKARGAEEAFEIIKSGGLFGELALINNQTRKIRATAAQNGASIFSYSAKDFFDLIGADTEINQKLINTLVSRIQQLEDPVKINLDLDSIKSNQNEESKKESPGEFFLDGHGNYNREAPESYQHYLYSKDIDCPACGNNFKAKIIRRSRLRLEKIKDNLRKVYKNFEPIWYRIRVCPQCYYAAPGIKFNDISKANKQKIRKEFKIYVERKISSQFQAGFSEPRNLNQVFNSYYLNIACYNFIGVEKEQVAASWLRLSWLYSDQDEVELANKASENAYQELKDFYYKENNQNLNSQAKEKLSLLLADLSIEHGHHEEAMPILDKIVRKSTTKPYYKELARDKFIKIREENNQKER